MSKKTDSVGQFIQLFRCVQMAHALNKADIKVIGFSPKGEATWQAVIEFNDGTVLCGQNSISMRESLLSLYAFLIVQVGLEIEALQEVCYNDEE